MAKHVYYAVRVGRDGPKVYNSWKDAEQAVSGFPGCKHKKFTLKEDAEKWIQIPEPSFTPHYTSNRTVPKANYTHNSNQENVYASNQLPLKRPASPVSQIYLRPAPSTPQAATLRDSSPGSSGNPIAIPSSPLGPAPRQATDTSQIGSSGHQSSNAHSLDNQSNETDATKKPQIELSDEQQRILKQVMKGKSLFFTGSAGTGKSVLMRRIIQDLRATYGAESVAVTAPTGIASVNVGGVTLHSWAGIGLGKEVTHVLADKVKNSKYSGERWRETRTLIIDEISMVDGLLFDKLEAIGRSVRENETPFGGIQLVVSGDFFQLPPVPDRHDGYNLPVTYAFDAKSWNRCVPHCYELTKVFRQKEQSFIDILNKMRYGNMDEKAIAQFYRLSRAVSYDDDIEPTQLFPRKDQVESANNERLRRLNGDTITFNAVDKPGVDVRGNKLSLEETVKSLDRLVALKQVSLRKGAQVMLIQNVVQGRLINGSLGRVVDFQTPLEARENHTSIAEVDNSRNEAMQPGNTPSGSVSGKQSTINADMCSDEEDEYSPAVKAENGSLQGGNSEMRWPIVEFTNGEILMLPPVQFSVVNMHGAVEATREQIPLILAWALSIHKAQGQTLERVKIDLGGVFEKGQAYVALSRATSIRTLQVLNFRPEKVMAHPRVIEWSKTFAGHISHDSDEEPSDLDEADDAADHRSESEDETFEDAVEVIELSD